MHRHNLLLLPLNFWSKYRQVVLSFKSSSRSARCLPVAVALQLHAKSDASIVAKFSAWSICQCISRSTVRKGRLTLQQNKRMHQRYRFKGFEMSLKISGWGGAPLKLAPHLNAKPSRDGVERPVVIHKHHHDTLEFSSSQTGDNAAALCLL